MKIKKIFVVVLALSIFSISCNSSSIKSIENFNNQYFPLKDRMNLRFRSTQDSELTKVNVTFKSENDSAIIYSFDKFPFIWGSDSAVNVYITRYGEIYCELKGQNLLFLESPEKLTSGNYWHSNGWNISVSEMKELIVNEEKFVDVKKVSYNLSITFTAEIWFSKGIGVIKWGFNRVNPPNPNMEYFNLVTY
ncbi:MAG: hypothetical protein WBP57_08955 [Ignavibacteria bacterium]|jgi:hypothetical protein|nr:MAG: hypothetical protein EDM69_05205 [Chlorobiota bacterium]KXK06119.1 MAG: hypothetical protein UZ04_CHB001000116 [Chlorobi bacterium OLB4]MBV6398548.1 hypothetical protein [Ignavibacteria bacterium]MCE7953023.1 hypothetical protein [Chlorobi bacterium CHB7]OQY78032.1 MAG: hypothetical protein B6D43_05830 [Ignavibacteriales bacterium UTCHB1]RIK49844.1 MAG: hypothetical protein DCC60_02155 [Ignavibacteriota bacterium]